MNDNAGHKPQVELDETPSDNLRRDLLKVLDPEGLGFELVSLMAGEREPTPDELSLLAELRARRGRHLYTDALFVLVHRYFEPARAEKLWTAVVRHKAQMSKRLGRDPGVSVAAVDYLTNVEGVLDEPRFIEESSIEAVAQTALHDGLTSLLNHKTLVARLREEVARAERYGGRFSLVMLDLDDFKGVNDRWGHRIGDDVLTTVGRIIGQQVRDTDHAGRYGGEEFGLVMPRTPLSEARHSAARILDAVRDAFQGTTGTTMSAGAAEYPTNGHTVDDLIVAADRALYRAKDQGKDAVAVAGPA